MAASDLLAPVGRLIRAHKSTIELMLKRQSERLELASVLSFAEHYTGNGWHVTVVNPSASPGAFVVKTRASGDPHKYSYCLLTKERRTLEIRMNLSVVGGRDPGVYCVDVAVLAPGRVPKYARGQSQATPNRFLITFGEAKALPVYPMLLAQFIGIVHEIKPRFMSLVSRAFGPYGHPPPTLIVLGRYSGNSTTIVGRYPSRQILVHVAEEIDHRLSRFAAGSGTSPLYS